MGLILFDDFKVQIRSNRSFGNRINFLLIHGFNKIVDNLYKLRHFQQDDFMKI